MAGLKQPADKSHFLLPDLGEGVHEAELLKWRVKPGQFVKEMDILADMETDKAVVEVPSPWAGTIKEVCAKEGEICIVGNVLVRYDIGSAANAAKPAVSTPSPTTAKAAPPAAVPKAPSNEEDQGTVVGSMSGTLSVGDRFARRAPEHAKTGVASGKALATPAVRRIAREMKVDIARVPGTGRGGRVTAGDIERATNGRGSSEGHVQRAPVPQAMVSRAPLALPPVSGDGVAQRIPFRGVRRKIAQALDLSVKTAVHFTVVDEADVTALDKKRKEYSAVTGQKLSLLPFIMLACCKALRKHPTVNCNVDDANEEILIKSVINFGCAVDTEHGLMVPVIHQADQYSLIQLADAVKDLAAKCQNRTVAREQLTGGTFTISNVGSYGGMFATPIINYPEIAILAAGRAKEKVLVKHGQFYAGLSLPLSLSCDHRVIDGAEGARFLNTVVKMLEDPAHLIG
ncbi:MAG: dihydrolipoamide acetyltransferase family protein [Phycisphaerae bacterium]|nr:dihydrolipoamide acetyltransferase family protein [Phycisphaerae bacterium]